MRHRTHNKASCVSVVIVSYTSVIRQDMVVSVLLAMLKVNAVHQKVNSDLVAQVFLHVLTIQGQD